ncbi:hypothetical protein, partial [Okeania sp. SIO3I5]|uniref:hypothetical protein n=1 Tax=Okeania sp. SIO3I5 TaxID=2607805 RepID=UPI0025F11031
KFKIQNSKIRSSGFTQANPETGFFPQCLLLKATIYPKNPVSLHSKSDFLFRCIRNSKFKIQNSKIRSSGFTQANPETGFFPQCLLLKATIYPKNPVSLRSKSDFLFRCISS